MVYTIFYAFVFLAEILISLFYFENKFERKSSKKFLLFSVVIVYVLLYSTRLLNLTLVNLIAFFACNFFLLYFCYFISVKSCIFHCSILLIFMAITESIVLFVSTVLFGTDFFTSLDNSLSLIIQATISKLLYFLIIYFVSKFSIKEHKSESYSLSIPLLVLPASSILLLYAISHALHNFDLEQKYIYLLIISMVLLLFSNIAVFWVYEFTLKTQRHNMKLEYERQKEKSTAEYYDLLNEQNENSKIVMHDITALLDNLLENAVEAAQNTENGFIDFSAFVRKNKYLSIQLTNSVKNIVAVKNNRIASSKKSDAIHGTGLKSIKRVVKKYDGEINMKFNEDDMTFTSNIVFEIRR